MAFADGQAKFVNEKIAYHVYQSLMAPDNRRSDMPNNAYLLKSADYE